MALHGDGTRCVCACHEWSRSEADCWDCNAAPQEHSIERIQRAERDGSGKGFVITHSEDCPPCSRGNVQEDGSTIEALYQAIEAVVPYIKSSWDPHTATASVPEGLMRRLVNLISEKKWEPSE